MFQILVVEDDKELRELFCTVLSDHGYHAIEACDGIQALELLEHTYIDLIVSDIMMPGMDGLTMTRALRDSGFLVPILMITAKDAPSDKREGFRAGTDDYMVKPIDVNEMVWRIEALLRRARIVNQRKTTLGTTIFDCDNLSVTCGNSRTVLPQKEFFLLYKLIASPNRIFTRRQIMDDVWGMDVDTDTHTLDVHISRLRERFKNNPDFEIITVRGLGYKVVQKDA